MNAGFANTKRKFLPSIIHSRDEQEKQNKEMKSFYNKLIVSSGYNSLISFFPLISLLFSFSFLFSV